MFSKMPEEISDIIKDEVENIRCEYQIVNTIIRNDIFNILEGLCIVLRYPLQNDEEANGVHVERWIRGERRHFVFINSNTPLEKQVYTAAHELGHVWEIDKRVNAKIDTSEDPEAIINRFAAELLMPEKEFIRCFIEVCRKLDAGEVVSKNVVLQVITQLMNDFMVPYKAVIYRMEEVSIINEDTRKVLEAIERDTPEQISHFVEKGNYQNLNQIRNEKTMGNLEEMLILAEQRGIYSDVKISNMRKRFDLERPEIDDEKIIPLVMPED